MSTFRIYSKRENIGSSKSILRSFRSFLILIFSFSFIHFIYIEFSLVHLLSFLIIYSSIFALLFVSKGDRKFLFPNIYVVLVFFALAFIGKFLSRYGYVSGLIQGESVFMLRQSSAGSGGLYSYIAIFFYPAALLIFYLSIKYKFSLLIYTAIYSFIFFDIFFLAMRMTPMFVLIFHALIVFSRHKRSPWLLFRLISGFIILLLMFSYTTKLKSFDPSGFSWETHLTNTISSQVVQFRPVATEFENDFFNSYLFLSHYLAHSIGEFGYYLSSDELNISNLRFLKLKEEFCVVTGCNVSSEIRAIDSRYGVYKTAFFVFIFDFGIILGMLVLLALLFTFMAWQSHVSHFSFGYFFVIYLIVLAPIENFVFTGLGLLQIMCIFVITLTSHLLSRVSNK